MWCTSDPYAYMLQRRTPRPGHGLVMVPPHTPPPVDLWWLWMDHNTVHAMICNIRYMIYDNVL